MRGGRVPHLRPSVRPPALVQGGAGSGRCGAGRPQRGVTARLRKAAGTPSVRTPTVPEAVLQPVSR